MKPNIGKCLECLYWDDPYGQEEEGLCRRRAATIGEETDRTRRIPWPETYAKDWCGEFVSFDKDSCDYEKTGKSVGDGEV